MFMCVFSTHVLMCMYISSREWDDTVRVTYGGKRTALGVEPHLLACLRKFSCIVHHCACNVTWSLTSKDSVSFSNLTTRALR